MATLWLKSAFILGIVAQIMIRSPYNRQRQQTHVATDRISRQEKVLLGLLFGSLVVPFIYIFTDWLAFADYTLPSWAGIAGSVLLLLSLWLFWRAHADLGRNWSPSLQIMTSHTLVTHGIYRVIRHPMYASQWVFGIAQILLLHNWLAGLATVLVFAPFYFLRVPQEEAMMLEQFGAAYRAYMTRTGRILPKWNS